jgi:hypothetical protein
MSDRQSTSPRVAELAAAAVGDVNDAMIDNALKNAADPARMRPRAGRNIVEPPYSIAAGVVLGGTTVPPAP